MLKIQDVLSDTENQTLFEEGDKNLLLPSDFSKRQLFVLGTNWPPRPLFIAQLVISLTVLIFCIVQLSIDRSTCDRSVMFSIITGICGYWLPQPKP